MEMYCIYDREYMKIGHVVSCCVLPDIDLDFMFSVGLSSPKHWLLLFILYLSGLEGGWGWLPEWGNTPDRGHYGNDSQLLRLEPLQPKQRGFTPLRLPETILVLHYGPSCSLVFSKHPCSMNPAASEDPSETFGVVRCLYSEQKELPQTVWTRICAVLLIIHIV